MERKGGRREGGSWGRHGGGDGGDGRVTECKWLGPHMVSGQVAQW